MVSNSDAYPAERDKFYTLSRHWGDKYHIHHKLPFLNVFATEDLIDKSIPFSVSACIGTPKPAPRPRPEAPAQRIPPGKYTVELTEAERAELGGIVADLAPMHLIAARSEILLLADMSDGRIAKTDEQIAQAVGVALNTVGNVRRQCVTLGLEVAVYGESGANSA